MHQGEGRGVPGWWAGAFLALAGVLGGCTTNPPTEVGTSASQAGGGSGGAGSTGGGGGTGAGGGNTGGTSHPTGQSIPRWSGAVPLAPGAKPPQFVVVSWDGSGADGSGLFQHYRQLAGQLGGSMTFFLTGIYLLPKDKRTLYQPPGRASGASDIGFLADASVRATVEQVGLAAREGHEIGTHFNGHFCGAKGVNTWSPADWDQEIEQAVALVTNWRANTGITDLPDLPFDYRATLVGGRSPCLEGRAALLQAQALRTWRYDSSGGRRQTWPTKVPGSHLWDLSLQSIPFGPRAREVLAMDYNFMANQPLPPAPATASPTELAAMQAQVRDAYLAGFRRSDDGNRAPLIIGNHFERWRGGIYVQGLDEALRAMASNPDVRFVSFRQLCDWLDAQPPDTLSRLQRLPVGAAPVGGWARL